MVLTASDSKLTVSIRGLSFMVNLFDLDLQISMNVKMVTMEAVVTSVTTHMEATSVLADLATSSREKRRGLGVAVA